MEHVQPEELEAERAPAPDYGELLEERYGPLAELAAEQAPVDNPGGGVDSR